MSTLTDCEDDGAGNDVAGNDCDQLDMIGPTIYYDTPDPGSTGYYAAYCRVHRMGDKPDWGKRECCRRSSIPACTRRRSPVQQP